MIKYLLILLALSVTPTTNMKKIYTFTSHTNSKEWRIVNDGVMGGKSTSELSLTKEGHGKYAGHVSLANYGGFASVQLNTSIKVAPSQKLLVLRVKGDGKQYEFRIKGALSQSESYVHPFKTSGEWETIKLPMSDFYPQFRGQKLDILNFNFDTIEQLCFLIANSKEEDFEILIDWIGLE